MRAPAEVGGYAWFATDGTTPTAATGAATAQIDAGDDVRVVTVVEHVLGSHLALFGQRQELTVVCVRSAASTG